MTADDEGRANVLDKAAGSGESFADHTVWASSTRSASPASALLRPSVAVGAFFLESRAQGQRPHHVVEIVGEILRGDSAHIGRRRRARLTNLASSIRLDLHGRGSGGAL